MSSPSVPARPQVGPEIEHHQCIEAACTTCSAKFGEDCVQHFGSLPETLAAIAGEGWEVTPDGVRCEDCVERCDSHYPTEVQVVTKCVFCWPPLFSDEQPPMSCQCADPDASLTHVVVPFISRAHSGFTQRFCVTLLCGDCGQKLDEDAERIPHFPDMQAALAAAAADYDWLITDALVCCRGCAKRRDCLTTGHRFAEAPDYITEDCVEVRWCTHCGETVRNLLTDPDTPWL